MTTSSLAELDLPDDELLRRIISAVAAHPEVREPLLRVLLTDELLNLPTEVRELREEMREGFRAVNERIDGTNASIRAQFETVNERIDGTNASIRAQFETVNERLDEHSHSISTLTGQVGELQGQMGELQGQMGELQGQMGELQGQMGELQGQVGELQGQMGELRGDVYERRCAAQVDAAMIDHFDLAVSTDRTSLNRQLIQARRNGRISREEYEGARNVDIIVQEQEDGDTPNRFAAIEVSITFNERDLRNAAERAAIIARITGIPTGAFLITRNEWPDSVGAVAARLGVTIIRRL